MTTAQVLKRIGDLRRRMRSTMNIYGKNKEELGLYRRCLNLRKHVNADVRGRFIVIEGGSSKKRSRGVENEKNRMKCVCLLALVSK